MPNDDNAVLFPSLNLQGITSKIIVTEIDMQTN